MKTNTPKIFLSYSWKDKDESLILERDFQRIGIPLIKDTLNLKFKDSLDDFMRGIRSSDFVIILLSDNYLKSQNCMFEALEIFKEQNYIKKIIPIFIKSPKIFNAQDRLKYIKYWKEEKEQLKAELEEVDVTSAIESYKDLKQIEVVYSSMDTVLKSMKSS